MNLVTIGLSVYAVLAITLTYALIRTAAPQNEAQQIENDKEQVEYLSKKVVD